MANGRFSRGAEIIADASLSFVGNFDEYSASRKSNHHDLFEPLPKELDLAIMDRFAAYIPGWEVQKTSSHLLTENYGLITDYIAKHFHYQFKKTSMFQQVSKRVKFGASIEEGMKKQLNKR